MSGRSNFGSLALFLIIHILQKMSKSVKLCVEKRLSAIMMGVLFRNSLSNMALMLNLAIASRVQEKLYLLHTSIFIIRSYNSCGAL